MSVYWDSDSSDWYTLWTPCTSSVCTKPTFDNVAVNVLLFSLFSCIRRKDNRNDIIIYWFIKPMQVSHLLISETPVSRNE